MSVKHYLEINGFKTNENGVYIYKSNDEEHRVNLAVILEDFLEFSKEKQYSYAVVYNEDSFEGIKVPLELLSLLMDLQKYSDFELFTNTTNDEDTFHGIEVDYASEARHGSKGTKEFNSYAQFKSWFLNRFHGLNQRVLQLLDDYDK